MADKRIFESGRTFGVRESLGTIEISYEAGIRTWNDKGEAIAQGGERGSVDFWLSVVTRAAKALEEAKANEIRQPFE